MANKYNITHIFADDTQMTNEEFMSAPRVIDYEKNKQLYTNLMRLGIFGETNKTLYKADNVQRASARREELQLELLRIQTELKTLPTT